MASLDELSIDELNALESQIKQAPQKASAEVSLDSMSVEQLDALEKQVKGEAPQEMSLAKSAGIGFQKGVSFGFRPALAGAGGAIGGLVGSLQSGAPIGRALSTAKQYYGEARQGALDEQKLSEQVNPKMTMAGDIGGSLMSLPFVAAKGIKGVSALGAVQGAGSGISEGKSVAGVATDAAKGAGLSLAGYGAAKAIGAGASAFANSQAGQKTIDVIKSGAQKIGVMPKDVAVKIAGAATGVPEQNIRTYAAQTDQVNEMIKRAGGDLTDEADKLRQGIQNGLRSTRQQLSGEVTAALNAMPDDVSVMLNGVPVIQALEKVRDRLNQNLRATEVAELTDLITKVRNESVGGLMKPRSMFEVKEFLQDRAKAAYMKDGQFFMPGKDAQQAAKAGAALARKELNAFSPEIAQANNKLSMLHALEDKINKNLIKPGSPDSALFAAGSGSNLRNAKMLQKIGEATGTNPLADAQVLSAARTFGEAKLLPVDATGKAAARMIGAGALGTVASGGSPLVGAAMTALTSPAALKTAINAGNITSAIARRIVGKATGQGAFTSEALKKTGEYLKTPEGQALLSNEIGASEAIRRRIGGQ